MRRVERLGVALLKSCTQSLFDFFDDDKPTLVIFDEPRVVADKLQILEKEFVGRIKTLCEGAEILPEHKDVCITAHEVKRQLYLLRKWDLPRFLSTTGFLSRNISSSLKLVP